jgi:hypothetical protein
MSFSGEDESADIKAEAMNPQIIRKFLEDINCTAQPISNMDEIGLPRNQHMVQDNAYH